MNPRALLTALAISTTGLAVAPVHAQTPDPCSVYVCMAGISGDGTTGGPECAGAIAAFHAIQIWDPHFDSGATAAARRTFLMTCPGAQVATNAAILEAIITQWGYIP